MEKEQNWSYSPYIPGSEYYSLERRSEIREGARKLRRQYLRYKEAEIIYSMSHTVEEHMTSNGLGNLVAGVVGRNNPVPVWMVGIPDEHIACGSQEYLKNLYGLTPMGIAKKALELVRVTDH